MRTNSSNATCRAVTHLVSSAPQTKGGNGAVDFYAGSEKQDESCVLRICKKLNLFVSY